MLRFAARIRQGRYYSVSATVSPSTSSNNNLGVTASKLKDFSNWYTQCLIKSEMLDYSDVSGCYILRPWGYSIWNNLQSHLSKEFVKRQVSDAYFPLLIPEPALQKETSHLEGFSPEVAWVTHAGSEKLSVRLAIRPTSETAMYPSFSRWIKSYRDLPLKLNQWCNVVRWEFNNPQPLIRSREFLWQEGHSAHSQEGDADTEVMDIINLYKRTYEELLAVPVTAGMKSGCEKFAGANYTTTIESFIPEVGRAIQAATAHNLGQNFAKMFDIKFEDVDGRQKDVWQTSWGFTTRSLGVMVMTHGDEKGLVLPPRVAGKQIVIIPVGCTDETVLTEIKGKCMELERALESSGIRVFCDLDDQRAVGWKFSQWELKGVPLRIEVGPREVSSGILSSRIRYSGERVKIPMDNIINDVHKILDGIQSGMLEGVRKKYNSCILTCDTWDKVIDGLLDKKMILMPWCRGSSCEVDIKKRTSIMMVDGKQQSGAKSLCIPFDQPIDKAHTCAACGKSAIKWTLFGRSF